VHLEIFFYFFFSKPGYFLAGINFWSMVGFEVLIFAGEQANHREVSLSLLLISLFLL